MDVRNFFGKNKKTARAAKTGLPPKAKTAVKAIVKKAIDRGIQDKRVGFTVESAVTHNSGISPADCRPLIDQIGQLDSTVGNLDQQRQGDKIRLKNMLVRGILALNPQAVQTTQSLFVRVMILAQKDIKVGSQIVAGNVDTAHLMSPDYNTGIGADQQPYTGSTLSTLRPINTDKFRVYYDKVFKLSGASNVTVQNEMNCVRWSYKFTKSKLPANLTYDAGNGDWANNFAPFLAIGYAYADGTAPDTVTTKIISHCDAYLTFEDA